MIRRCLMAGLLLCLSACPKIGPDYTPPDPTVAERWRDADRDDVDTTGAPPATWWDVFGDPTVARLVDLTRRRNPSLEAAAIRVLEARARRGIAVGGLYPQRQDATGAWTRVELSEARANQANPQLDHSFDDWAFGGDAAWELDLWGRIRRGIEAADAGLLAQVADYDDVLVSLVADVVGAYVQVRVLDARLAVARRNIEIQRRSRDIASAKVRHEMTSELDVAQADALLGSTVAAAAALEAERRVAENGLAVLLGLPPQRLDDVLGVGDVPTPPTRLSVGIPADLLRRRPDVRRLERQLAAQSAQIGIAKADLLPRLSLTGVFTVAAEDFADLGSSASIDAFGGPTLRWAILNYGRITNNVRVQDARFQALVASYEATVLRAQREVEDAMIRLSRARERIAALETSAAASRRAVNISQLQYREGLADYVRLLNAQERLLSSEERLVGARGEAAQQVVALYRSLGGGWEVRLGESIVSPDVVRAMRDRTWWGGLTEDTDDLGPGDGRSWWRRWLPAW